MKRYSLYLDGNQVVELKRVGGVSMAEHIRRAIALYLKSRVSTSPSTKVGEKNGK